MYVGNIAPADRGHKACSQYDDRQPSHERARIARVVGEHGADDPRKDPWSREREAHQLEAAASDGSDLHHRQPSVRRRVDRAAAARAKCEEFDGKCNAVRHRVQLAKYERLREQGEAHDHVGHGGVAGGVATAARHAVQR